jgi:hypothetical protein
MRDTPLFVTKTVVVLAGAVALLFGGTALFAQDASEKPPSRCTRWEMA